jgi:hypothetical protein
MIVETKFFKAFSALIIFILGFVLFFLLVGSLYEPMDTFPRLYKTAACSDESWSSVAVHRRKSYWFSSDTDVVVTVSNSQGKIVHQERLYQFDSWNDLAGTMSETAPAGFCNKKLSSRDGIGTARNDQRAISVRQ